MRETSNYKLTQWDKTDRIKMEDFNSDNSKIDAALKTLAKENFSHLSPSPLLVVLEYSHPPLSQRVEAIDRALNKR